MVYQSKTLGKVKLLGKVQKSRTLVNVQCIDRGRGWNEDTQTYKGVSFKTPSGKCWFRGQNYQYGEQFTVRKDSLTKI